MKKVFSSKTIGFFFVIVIVAGSIGAAGYFYNEYQKVKKNPDLIAKQETKSVTDSIRKFMDLPGDEEPTLATITDKEKLKDQEFFRNAQNGDKVVIYTKARKAILYRPSTGRVIEFAPLVLGAGEGTETQPQTSETKPVTIAIYNGTKTAGLSGEYEKKLSGMANLSIVSKANAKKDDYTKTMVIDLSGTHKDLATQISQAVGGEVGDQLPLGETKPQADILVIAGK